MFDWLKENEYLATWLGLLIAILALVPFRKIRWDVVGAVIFLLLFIPGIWLFTDSMLSPKSGLGGRIVAGVYLVMILRNLFNAMRKSSQS